MYQGGRKVTCAGPALRSLCFFGFRLLISQEVLIPCHMYGPQYLGTLGKKGSCGEEGEVVAQSRGPHIRGWLLPILPSLLAPLSLPYSPC